MRAPGLAVLAVLAMLVAAALAGSGVAPRPPHAQAPDLVAVARAFNAAWNAHDVEAVTALFAPGATIRQTRASVVVAIGAAEGEPDPPAAEDTYGAGRRALPAAQAAQAAPGRSAGDVLWAAGPPGVRAWLPWFFAAGHRVEASAYRAAGDTVTWRYRAFADPYQGLAGVEPVEGTAELVVQAGRIAAFTFATEAATVARRERQFDAAVSARAAADRAAHPPDGPRPRGPAAPLTLPPDPLLLLGLLGAAALAGLVGALRRRARPA